MTVSIEQAQLKLAELLRQTSPEEIIVVTEADGTPIAELTVKRPARKRKAGFLKGKIHFDPDDDSHLDAFKDYM